MGPGVTASPEHYVEVNLADEEPTAAVRVISIDSVAARPLKAALHQPRGEGNPLYKKAWIWVAGGTVLAAIAVAVALGVVLSQDGAASSQQQPADNGGLSEAAAAELGFEVLRRAELEDLGYTATFYRHTATGAKVFSIRADDPNNAMGAVFRTPPNDDTGKPHVLEHSLLQGSERYPVQHPGPFMRLLRGSLSTFLNAYTYPDRTVYPVSTASQQEFRSLVAVYLDALFHPLFPQQEVLFRQEGWRYELSNASDPASLDIAGVVYSEMTGAYANPQTWLLDSLYGGLFPNTTYAYSSGGKPWVMPELSFEDMQSFYYQYYHPSNARLYFYGDAPEAERLQLLAEALAGFDANPDAASASAIRGAAPFDAPRTVTANYPAGPTQGDAYAVTSWALGDAEGSLPLKDELPLAVLNGLLLGSTSAPLHAALLSSDLGSSPITDGLASGNSIQPVFLVGLHGVAPGNESAVHELVLDTLAAVRAEGFAVDAVRAEVNAIVLAMRGGVAESSQWGVDLLLALAGPWVYGQDLVQALQVSGPVRELMARVDAGEDVFGPLLDKYLLQNPHRLDLAMQPSTSLAVEHTAADGAHLAAVYANMTSAQHDMLAADTVAFREFQAMKDPSEEVAKLPVLQASDLSPKVEPVVGAVVDVDGGGQLLLHPQPTGGLLFARLSLSLEALEPADLALLNLLGAALRQTGTAEEKPAELEERIRMYTGGVSLSFEVLSAGDNPATPVPMLLMQGKATASEAGRLLDIMADLLLRPGMDSPGAGAIMTPLVDSLEQLNTDALLTNGMTAAARRGKAMLSTPDWMDEQIEGLPQLEGLRRWQAALADPTKGWPALRQALRDILARLLSAPRPLLSLAADEAELAAARPAAEALLASVAPTQPAPPRSWDGQLLSARTEALLLPTDGSNYVTSSADLSELPTIGAASYAGESLLSAWLTAELRAQRGAYGAFASLQRSGVLTMATYRDPGLGSTVDVFSRAGQFLQDWAASPDASELNAAIISAVKDLDPYQPPAQRSLSGLLMHATGRSTASRDEDKAALLAATPEDVAELGVAIARANFGVVAATGPAGANSTASDGAPLFQVVLPIEQA